MATDVTPFEALQSAVEMAGSQSAFARIIRVSQAAVWKWLAHGKSLPPEHVLIVERETGVSRHLLRPDIYPAESPAMSPTGSPKGSVGTGGAIVRCDRAALLQRDDA